jgi:hypothetical protein
MAHASLVRSGSARLVTVHLLCLRTAPDRASDGALPRLVQLATSGPAGPGARVRGVAVVGASDDARGIHCRIAWASGHLVAAKPPALVARSRRRLGLGRSWSPVVGGKVRRPDSAGSAPGSARCESAASGAVARTNPPDSQHGLASRRCRHHRSRRRAARSHRSGRAAPSDSLGVVQVSIRSRWCSCLPAW